ncbi:MAG: methyltransferase domain-containing protein [Rhizobiales bacterium]|nr:methyltransferase domain-containing protein [Hyphomicrobiales bacterium]
MTLSRSFTLSLPASAAAVIAALSFALAEPKAPFEPRVGQSGKDVIWVPTAQALVDRMLNLAEITPADLLMDLGSGDGRTVITAASRGTRAIGVEYNPEMVVLSRRNAKVAGVSERATFMEADLFATDFSKATVVTMFLLPSINLKLRPKILEMRPGTRVVSNSFDMGDWRPEQTVEAPGECTSYCRAHLWIVPAKVEGTWKLPEGDMRLEQTYQTLHGTLRSGNSTMNITDGKVIGETVSFIAGDTRYTGRVNGNAIEGLSPRELMSRFRSSYHLAAPSFTNFGIGTLKTFESSGFGSEVRRSDSPRE